jgi:hypothetical protein
MEPDIATSDPGVRSSPMTGQAASDITLILKAARFSAEKHRDQ